LQCSMSHSSFEFVNWDVVGVLSYDGVGDLPDLDEVVLSSAADDPGLGLVPAEVCEVVGVAAVHEKTV